MATQPLYTWKEDQKKKDSQTGTGTSTLDASTPMPARTSFDDSLNPSIAPQPKQPDMSRSFGSMIQDIPERQQAVESAYKTTAEQIGGAQGPESTLARNQFLKGQQEALRDIKETSTLAGRADTGQIRGDVAQFYTKQAMPARQDFEAQLAANAAAQKGAGVQNLISLENLAQTGEIAREDITIRREQLAQNASQFQDEQAFKRYALDRGYNEAEIERAWTSGENQLNRELDKYISDRGYDIDLKQLSEQIRQFDSRLDFDEWATQMGFDENDKTRFHELRMQEIQNKYAAGERIASQDWEYMMQEDRQASVQQEMNLANILQLDTMEKQNEYDASLLTLRETYATAARQEGFNHETALAQYQAGVQENLTQMGIDAETAQQAAQIEADRINMNRELEFKERIAMAQMAQEDEQFAQELGLRKEDLELTRMQIMDALITSGVQREVLQNEIVMNNLDTATVLFEMAGDNQDMLNTAAQHMFGVLGTQFEMTPEQIDAGVAAITGGGDEIITPGNAKTANDAIAIVEKTGNPQLSIKAIKGFTPDEIQAIIDDPANLMNAGIVMKPTDRFEDPRDYVGKLKIVGDKLFYIEGMGDYETETGTKMTNQLKVVDLKTGQTGYWST